VARGCLAIILHAHLPFVRHPEYDDSIEERWFHAAVTESYIPLLLMMERLAEDQIEFRLTFSISPPLASMFGDRYLQSRYLRRLEQLMELADKEVRRTRTTPGIQEVARFYRRRLRLVHDAFVDRWKRNLAGAFRRLQDGGHVEIIASAATHGYLPLLSIDKSAVRAQVRIGVEHYRQMFRARPRGFWLPECGFYPGVDVLLAKEGIRYTILETHGITRADPRPDAGVYAPVVCPSGVAAFGRDPESSRQVWSSIDGYPGDYDYREYYRDIAYDLDLTYIAPYIHPTGVRLDTGFKYYRVTGRGDHKQAYVPERAEEKARLHASHFVAARKAQISHLATAMDRRPLVVAPYDAELFGHWWFEGPIWLEQVIRQVASRPRTIQLVTLSDYLGEHPAMQVSTPSASSWGYKGYSETWMNASNHWIYPHLHQGALTMERLVRRNGRARGLTARALQQAARELLLAQSSDWAFMINAGSTSEYAARRTTLHLARLARLARDIDRRTIDERWLSAVQAQDNIFPDADYRLFR
jgi:1,4-alpha-glucan branching enzyme